MVIWVRVNSLPNDKRVEKKIGKGRKCWLPAFFPFPKMFLKRLCGKELTLPNDKILDWSKLKELVFQTTALIYVNENLKFGLGWVENMLENRENAGSQHFFLVPKCSLTTSFSGSALCGKYGENAGNTHLLLIPQRLL